MRLSIMQCQVHFAVVAETLKRPGQTPRLTNAAVATGGHFYELPVRDFTVTRPSSKSSTVARVAISSVRIRFLHRAV